MEHRRGQAYGLALRARALAMVDAGQSCRAVAERLLVSASYVIKAVQRRERTGETEARPQRSHQRPVLEPFYPALRAKLDAQPDITLAELRRWLLAEHGVAASSGGVWNALSRLDLTRKKSRGTRASRSAPTSPPPAPPGARRKAVSTPAASSSSTRPGRART